MGSIMKFIAELCQNHIGDMNIRREMVKHAAESGAEFVKIQEGQLILNSTTKTICSHATMVKRSR